MEVKICDKCGEYPLISVQQEYVLTERGRRIDLCSECYRQLVDHLAGWLPSRPPRIKPWAKEVKYGQASGRA